MIPSISFNRTSTQQSVSSDCIRERSQQPLRKRQRGRNKVSGSLFYSYGMDIPVIAYLAKHTWKLSAEVETCCDKPFKQIAVKEVGFEFGLQIDWPSPRNRHSVSYLTYYNERHALFVCFGKVCDVWKTQKLKIFPNGGSRNNFSTGWDLSCLDDPTFAREIHKKQTDISIPAPVIATWWSPSPNRPKGVRDIRDLSTPLT